MILDVIVRHIAPFHHEVSSMVDEIELGIDAGGGILRSNVGLFLEVQHGFEDATPSFASFRCHRFDA